MSNFLQQIFIIPIMLVGGIGMILFVALILGIEIIVNNIRLGVNKLKP